MGPKPLYSLYLVLIFSLLFSACRSEDTNTCEQDRFDKDWQAIVDSSQCSGDQKGEAYLALGGFDYMNFITHPDAEFSTTLGISSIADAEAKLAYFTAASNQVKSRFQTDGEGVAKTIYFLASSLELYTYTSLKLDNGDGTADAFDGIFATNEIEVLTGSGLSDASGDGTTIDTSSNLIQFKPADGLYYVLDINATKYYLDTSADGDISGDTEIVDIVEKATLSDASEWTEANQVVYLTSLVDPFAGAINVNSIKSFVTKLVGSNGTDGYMDNFENSLLALGLDSSSDIIEEINSFNSNVDNGATCSTLNDNPALRIMELIVNKTAKDPLSDYSTSNVFSVSDLEDLGETDTSTDTIPGFTGDIGLKMLFRQSSGNYVANWEDANDATTDCCMALTTLSDITSKSSVKDDGEVTTSELMCLIDTFSN